MHVSLTSPNFVQEMVTLLETTGGNITDYRIAQSNNDEISLYHKDYNPIGLWLSSVFHGYQYNSLDILKRVTQTFESLSRLRNADTTALFLGVKSIALLTTVKTLKKRLKKLKTSLFARIVGRKNALSFASKEYNNPSNRIPRALHAVWKRAMFTRAIRALKMTPKIERLPLVPLEVLEKGINKNDSALIVIACKAFTSMSQVPDEHSGVVLACLNSSQNFDLAESLVASKHIRHFKQPIIEKVPCQECDDRRYDEIDDYDIGDLFD